MLDFSANHTEEEDSISFVQQPIRWWQIGTYINETDGGPDSSLAVSLRVADCCCSLSAEGSQWLTRLCREGCQLL